MWKADAISNICQKKLRKNLENKKFTCNCVNYKENGRYYLHVSITLQYTAETICTRKEYGTIGIDFNKGMLAIAETDQAGNLKKRFPKKICIWQGRKNESTAFGNTFRCIQLCN